jgi:hypothetical protein
LELGLFYEEAVKDQWAKTHKKPFCDKCASSAHSIDSQVNAFDLGAMFHLNPM